MTESYVVVLYDPVDMKELLRIASTRATPATRVLVVLPDGSPLTMEELDSSSVTIIPLLGEMCSQQQLGLTRPHIIDPAHITVVTSAHRAIRICAIARHIFSRATVDVAYPITDVPSEILYAEAIKLYHFMAMTMHPPRI